MTATEGEPEPSAAERLAHDLPLLGTLAEQAYQLGQRHRHDEIALFGDAGYVYWDQGSSRLMSTLGVTSPTTGENWRERQLVVEAYCDALESPDPPEIEPDF